MKKILTLITLTIGVVSMTLSQPCLTKFKVGDIAPDFKIVDGKGKTHTLYQYTNAGKYVLIDFFEVYCGPCKRVSPMVEQFYKKYGCNNYDVVVLGIDRFGNDAQVLIYNSQCTPPLSTIDTYPAAAGLGNGNGAVIQDLYGALGWPDIVVIGPDKKFIKICIWPINNLSSLEAVFPAGKLTPHSCTTTNIAEPMSEKSISVYPNPVVNNTVIVDLNLNESGEVALTMSNTLGQVVLQEDLGKMDAGMNKYLLNTSLLSSGLYFINIKAGENVISKKVTINK